MAATTYSKPESACSPGLPGQVVLVLQGGGALGAYQVGVYEALHEAGIEPDWVIGTSIGAINGALIAGNPPKLRLARLEEFWRGVAQGGAGHPLANAGIVALGLHRFFSPNPLAALGIHLPVGVERAAFYDTGPLRDTLAASLDLEQLNAGAPRLTVGAVNVKSGAMHYFDSRHERLGVAHIMASGALPPAFPAVRVGGDPYWDGGVFSNTPLEAVFDDRPRRDSLIFAVNVWHPRGEEPQTIWQAMGRQKDIQYASRADSHIFRQHQLHRLRHIISELGRRLPPEERSRPEVKDMLAYGCTTHMHVVRLQAPRLPGEDAAKDIDFSAEGIAARRHAGHRDARRMLRRAPWLAGHDPLEGVTIHDPQNSGKGRLL